MTVGEWATVGAAVGVVAASLAAALTAWKLVDRVVNAIRGVVREEQRPVRSEVHRVQEQVEEVRTEVTTNHGMSLRDAVDDIRRDQLDHIAYARARDARLDEHAEKLGQLDERVSRLEGGR